MPVMRTYQCPDCGHRFDFLHMHADEAPPNYCQNCGSFVGDDPKPEPASPHLAGVAGKSGDMVYRAMEDSSAVRADMAAEAMGVDASEMSSLKVTDMKDGMREGDTSHAVSISPETAAAMSRPGMGWVGTGNNPLGPGAAGHGDPVRQGLRDIHQENAWKTVKAGEMGTYNGKQ